MTEDSLKRLLRRYKKTEAELRPGKRLIWAEYFAERGERRARYSLAQLLSLGDVERDAVFSEYFADIYFRYATENGVMSAGALDPALLKKLGLPPDADAAEVRGRFRALAMELHPDRGGDASRFIEMMEVYRRLTGGM